MCIGSICAYLRTGNEDMSERALQKLDNLSETLLYSRDQYSYLLAKLTAAVARRFVQTSYWPQIERLQTGLTEPARAALVQFARSAFINRRALVWPAQAAGIEQLRDNSSFVLCTPTGSGKTTVATLAVVQSLFAEINADVEETAHGNLVLYLVPSRALAAEVESRFAQDLRGISADPVVVTGLYGGIDWGPTDAWIQTDSATIVICTFEKADALIRYLGILFLNRVRLVIIDEAHMVEQNISRLDSLKNGTSRAFRLEQLGARLFRAREQHGFRVIALSAVAASAAPALARWVGGTADATPTTSSYRSTRQMLGRLEVTAGGQYSIHYDLMDGRSLRFTDERRANTPYVPNPFPQLPGGVSAEDGVEVRMRAPTLWAALHLASRRPDGSTPSVMISLTQDVEAFAATCADLMDHWPARILPDYRAVDETSEQWVRCLAIAADYFTPESVEYRLLQRGIAVHHGKMPPVLARRLKLVIDRGFVRVVIATSTLSEGVNIPVSYLLIPSVFRGVERLSLQEFTNLVGRAGRPGVATEGSALVVLPERLVVRGRRLTSRQWDGYAALISTVERSTAAANVGQPLDAASSALGLLLNKLEEAWRELTGGATNDEFETWLEQTVLVNEDENNGDGEGDEEEEEGEEERELAFGYLDSLDAFLLAALQEVEELRNTELTPAQVEDELTAIWRRTYAFAAAHEEDRLARIWLARGRAIKTLYPNARQRRRMYKSSLSPRSATRLLRQAEAIRAALQAGAGYMRFSTEQQFEFIRGILEQLSLIPAFRISTKLGKKRTFRDWPTLLRWWLAKRTLATQPEPKQITAWYQFVSDNFIYRGAWGLGSVIGVLLDADEGETPIKALEIADWPRSGLPWIAFWLKELITWGTLDPVAAFLLAKGDAIDRPRAERDARAYYDELDTDIDPNDALDPRTIRDWVEARRPVEDERRVVQELDIDAQLARRAAEYRAARLPVLPLDISNGLLWIDAAGYSVARSRVPADWPENPATFEFELDVRRRAVLGNAYLPHSR